MAGLLTCQAGAADEAARGAGGAVQAAVDSGRGRGRGRGSQQRGAADTPKYHAIAIACGPQV